MASESCGIIRTNARYSVSTTRTIFQRYIRQNFMQDVGRAVATTNRPKSVVPYQPTPSLLVLKNLRPCAVDAKWNWPSNTSIIRTIARYTENMWNNLSHTVVPNYNASANVINNIWSTSFPQKLQFLAKIMKHVFRYWPIILHDVSMFYTFFNFVFFFVLRNPGMNFLVKN